MTDILTVASQLTTIFADMLIILPFLSRDIRRKLFRAIIADILYDIIQGNNGEIKKLVNVMKGVVEYYERTRVSSKEVDD